MQVKWIVGATKSYCSVILHLRVLCGVGKSRERDKLENSHLECVDWKQRTVTAHPTWLKILFKIIICSINQDKGWKGCLSEASLYFAGNTWSPSKNTPRSTSSVQTPEWLRGTAWLLSTHEWNQLKGPIEFSCVNKKKVMHPHWPQCGQMWQMLWDPIFWISPAQAGRAEGISSGQPSWAQQAEF